MFWIVKHGIKFTGMLAWPVQQRDDEVWAVVAFLLQLSELTPARYWQLAYGERAPGQDHARARLTQLDEPLRDVIEDCVRCHGTEGLGHGEGAFPKLACQSERYLYETLRAYADGARWRGAATSPSRACRSRALPRAWIVTGRRPGGAIPPTRCWRPVPGVPRRAADAVQRGSTRRRRDP